MFRFKEFKHIFFMFGIFILVGFIAGYASTADISLNQYAVENHNSSSEEENLEILENNNSGDNFRPEQIYREVKAQKLYEKCGHTEATEIKGLEEGLMVNEIRDKFSEEDGYLVEDTGEYILVTEKASGLCPNDRKKRHFSIFGGYLAARKGPAGINGEILEVTDIRVRDLPLELQLRINNELIEFESEEEMYQALDSLDEYIY